MINRDNWLYWMIGAVVAAVLVIAGIEIRNEFREPESGRVTEKVYHPPYVTTMCAGYNAQGTCIAWVPQYHPERHEIIYHSRGEYGDDDVSPTEYDRIKIGDWYPEGSS